MVDTTFVPGTTIASSWLNDVNDLVYGLPDTSNVALGDALVGVLQPVTGAMPRTQHSKNLDVVSVRDFGAVGDGVTSDAARLNAANTSGASLVVPAGTYLIDAPVTFARSPIVMQGAVFRVRTGGSITFSAGLDAGHYTIFDTLDDFITTFQGNTSVVILGCVVKADWFCTKVQTQADILTIADQTNNLLKAYRAAVGNWVPVPATANFICQYPQGVLELGTGYYRVDGNITIGKQIGGSFYRTTGFRMFGHGAGSSYFVRTATTSTSQVLSSFYTGELTHFEKFKITVYNPSLVGAAQFQGAASAMVFLQGDSLQINNIWVAGGQVSSGADANGIYRNGVGFQFSSCVDTFFHDLFVEYCVTGLAFYSSVVTGSNTELYHTLRQGIGMGEFESAYPAVQTTSSSVHLTGIQHRAAYNNGIAVLEQGSTGELQISDGLFNGFDAETPAQGGVDFCLFATGTSLNGGIASSSVRNFTSTGWKLANNCSLGRTDQAYMVMDLTVQGITVDTNGGIFFNAGTSAFMNLVVQGLCGTDINGLVLQAAQGGNVTVENVSLSRYVGKVDASANRSLFVGLGANITLRDFRRNPSDPVALNQFGFASSGAIYIDVQASINATRVVNGTPSSVRMPSTAVFV